MPDLPTDEEQLIKMLTDRLVSETPRSRNYEAGNPIKDWETQNYRNTDPSAGTGDGAHCEPQKIEVI